MNAPATAGLAHAPQDAGVADYLARDLAGQGVAVVRTAGGAGPLLILIAPGSAHDPGLQHAAANAAQAGRPIHVVRLGPGQVDWPALHYAASWTDAYGDPAQANVAALAARLRALPAASPWAAAAPPIAPSPWANAMPPAPPRQDLPREAPPSGHAEPSDRGSLIALLVIAGLGLLLLVLNLTGVLKLGSDAPSATAQGAPAAPVAGGVTDQWLTGTWKENCAAREFMRFDLARGTATFHNGAGRVTRSGDTLTISGSGGSIVMRVAYLGQDQMRATAQGGSQTLNRCG